MQRADRRQFHYIYKIIRDDGKYYIGMHSTDDLDDGYFGSGQRISRSIKKHGKERHIKEILEFCDSRLALKRREKELITDELRADDMCMNIAPGGGGGFIDAEHALRAQRSGGKSAVKSGQLAVAAAKSRSPESMRKRRERNTLKWGNAWGKRCDHTGMTRTQQTRENMRAAKIGSNNNQFGKKWMTDGETVISVALDQIQIHLDRGFVFGRKINWG